MEQLTFGITQNISKLHTKGKDPTEHYHGGNYESSGAWKSITTSDLSNLRIIVLDTIRSHSHGATCDEIEIELGLSHQTVSARITELKAMDFIVKVGTRKTRTGRSAAVYIKNTELEFK